MIARLLVRVPRVQKRVQEESRWVRLPSVAEFAALEVVTEAAIELATRPAVVAYQRRRH
jgi:hypothetical protein